MISFDLVASLQVNCGRSSIQEQSLNSETASKWQHIDSFLTARAKSRSIKLKMGTFQTHGKAWKRFITCLNSRSSTQIDFESRFLVQVPVIMDTVSVPILMWHWVVLFSYWLSYKGPWTETSCRGEENAKHLALPIKGNHTVISWWMYFCLLRCNIRTMYVLVFKWTSYFRVRSRHSNPINMSVFLIKKKHTKKKLCQV